VKLKLDENLGRSALRAFEDAGHDTSTIYVQQMGGAPDTEVHEVCRSEDRVLVTLDLDFANPLVFDPAARLAVQFSDYRRTPVQRT
jgi:predicted nuclease of predicted toxin-antitoxin system